MVSGEIGRRATLWHQSSQRRCEAHEVQNDRFEKTHRIDNMASPRTSNGSAYRFGDTCTQQPESSPIQMRGFSTTSSTFAGKRPPELLPRASNLDRKLPQLRAVVTAEAFVPQSRPSCRDHALNQIRRGAEEVWGQPVQNHLNNVRCSKEWESMGIFGETR